MAIAKQVIVAAGHGGGDAGATGQGSTEAAETIQLTKRVVDILEADGRLKVVHVPDSLNLVPEISWVNKRFKSLNSGLAIEIHKNAASAPAHGVETWYYTGDDTSRAMAKKVQASMVQYSGLPDRGVHGDKSNRWGRLGWVRDLKPWSLLIEAGFISNGGDPINDTQDEKTAKGIADGILRVWGMRLQQTKPVPAAKKLPARLNFTAKLADTEVWDLTTNPHYKSVETLHKGDPFVAFASINFNNDLYYVTEYSYSKGLKNGVNSKDLVAVKPKPTPTPTPKPTPQPTKDQQQDKQITDIQNQVSSLKQVVDKVLEFLASVFKNFKK